jgi:hypothetical protein
MLVESITAQGKLAEDMQAQGELVEDKPAQGELLVDKLGEQHKRKLHQMEADSPAVIVIAYMCMIGKLGNGEGLRIGMDPLRGVFWTLEGLV